MSSSNSFSNSSISNSLVPKELAVSGEPIRPCKIIPCAEQIKNTYTDTIINGCPSSACLYPSNINKEFYKAVDWKYLTKNMLRYMQIFITIIRKDEIIMEKLKSLYDNNDLIVVENIKLEGKDICEDILVFFKLNTIDKIVLFHISLHSLIPKYTISTNKRYTGCSYYKKGASSNMGAFHYKIHTIDSKTRIPPKYMPYKQFIFEGTGDIPYYFQSNTDRFNNLDDDTYSIELRDEVNILHNLLYNKFVSFWNYYILPEILTHLGGGRKTRKYKNKKRKYRRSIRKTL